MEDGLLPPRLPQELACALPPLVASAHDLPSQMVVAMGSRFAPPSPTSVPVASTHLFALISIRVSLSYPAHST
ncbi:hypothetical protein ABZP36_007240 [Zizania latifolia]